MSVAGSATPGIPTTAERLAPGSTTRAVTPTPTRTRTRTILPDVGGADAAICAYLLGFLVLWVPAVHSGLVTPRIALLWVGTGPGLVVLVGLTRRGDAAARWAIALLAWLLLATLASRQPRIAFLGGYGVDRGFLVLAGYASAWALGRRLQAPGRRLVPWVLLVGIGLSTFVGLLTAVAGAGSGDMAIDGGRIKGLTPQSIYFGGLVAGAMALLACRIARRLGRWPIEALGLAVVAGAANLSGSRGALVGGGLVGVAVAVLAAFRPPNERAGAGGSAGLWPWWRVVLVVGSIVLGVAASMPFTGSTGSTERIQVGTDAAGGGGLGPRATMWGAALHAVAERPLVGWGPNQFQPATSSLTKAAFARAEGPDRTFFEAHDLAVELLVDGSVVALVLAVGFAATAGRRARGPLAWFALGGAATWLLSPVSISVGPVVLLVLGAAWDEVRVAVDAGPGAEPDRAVTPARVVGAGLLVVGLLGGGSLLVADRVLVRGVRTGDVAALEHAQRFYPPDAVLADTEAAARRRLAGLVDDPEVRADALAASRRPVELEPTRPLWWINLAYAEADLGPGTEAQRLTRAGRALDRALELNPWSSAALNGRYQVAVRLDDGPGVADLADRLCRIGECPEDDG